MASAAVDHMISLIIFISAIIIFIGLFSDTMQTGIAYEQHQALSTKTSDLLDTILLNPGIPINWAQTDSTIVAFGLQDPDYSQYKLSSLSPMRLSSSTQPLVYYMKTNAYYSNISSGFESSLLLPTGKTFNYTSVSKLLGINGTYGFQLTLTPTLSVSIEKISIGAPLKLAVSVSGSGYPLANAPLSYSLILVNQNTNQYPSYTIMKGSSVTDSAGSAQLVFSSVDGEGQTYSLIVYSYLSGLKGIGSYVHTPLLTTKNVVPLIDSFQNRSIIIAHGDSVGQPPEHPSYSELSYNVTFAILTEDYSLSVLSLDQPASTGNLDYNSETGQDFASVNIPNNDGVLIVTFKDNSGGYGMALVPWGLGSLALPLTFGGNPLGHNWVTTDIRQVSIGGISYQAKLELWSLQGGRVS
jgi:hypothetical protein